MAKSNKNARIEKIKSDSNEVKDKLSKLRDKMVSLKEEVEKLKGGDKKKYNLKVSEYNEAYKAWYDEQTKY